MSNVMTVQFGVAALEQAWLPGLKRASVEPGA